MIGPERRAGSAGHVHLSWLAGWLNVIGWVLRDEARPGGAAPRSGHRGCCSPCSVTTSGCGQGGGDPGRPALAALRVRQIITRYSPELADRAAYHSSEPKL